MGAGYHVAYQRSSEVVDPLYADKVIDCKSEDEHDKLKYTLSLYQQPQEGSKAFAARFSIWLS